MQEDPKISIEDNDFQKPIKKKELENDDFDNFSQSETNELQEKARNDLILFLSNKPVDIKALDEYEIHVHKSKNRKGKDNSSFSVQYTAPDGSILTSKTDVLNSILQSTRNNSHEIHDFNPDIKSTIFEEASIKTAEILPMLPLEFGNIKVISLGKINSATSFHTFVQIYPIGYKCEIWVNGFGKVNCEIVEVGSNPQFLFTVDANGRTYLEKTEEIAWRKVSYIFIFP